MTFFLPKSWSWFLNKVRKEKLLNHVGPFKQGGQTYGFFFIGMNKKPIYLICWEVVSVFKSFNVQRHFKIWTFNNDEFMDQFYAEIVFKVKK